MPEHLLLFVQRRRGLSGQCQAVPEFQYLFGIVSGHEFLLRAVTVRPRLVVRLAHAADAERQPGGYLCRNGPRCVRFCDPGRHSYHLLQVARALVGERSHVAIKKGECITPSLFGLLAPGVGVKGVPLFRIRADFEGHVSRFERGP